MYGEGATYWGYGTAFHIALIELLVTSFGKDFGLADFPGFLESAKYMLQMTGPAGTYFNYADGRGIRTLEPPLFLVCPPPGWATVCCTADARDF